MIPFAIAGVQMPIPALQDNTSAVVAAVGGVVAHFPWVQMVVFSELACCGPLPNNPVTLPGPEESALRVAAHKHGVWLIPGSISGAAATAPTIPVRSSTLRAKL